MKFCEISGKIVFDLLTILFHRKVDFLVCFTLFGSHSIPALSATLLLYTCTER